MPGAAIPDPDPYPVEAKRTAANVAALLAPSGLTAADWFFAFQSQGMSGGTWIGPTVEDTLTALRQEGHSAVVIQPIGFLCDHVEILYDIDIGFRDFAAGIGLEVVRPQSLNDSPLLTATLEDLARQGIRPARRKGSLRGPLSARLMIAIVGGGIAGLATAYQLARDGVEFTLFEASERLGGIVETVHRDGFRHRVRARFLGHGKAMGARACGRARPRRPDHPLERSMAAHVRPAGQLCAKRDWSPFPTECA